MKEQELEPRRMSKWRKPNYAIRYIENSKGCWMCTSHKLSNHGYARIRLDGKLIQMHRYIYLKYVGEIPEGFCVMHLCDNKSCINPAHLRADTLAANTLDGWAKGLYPQNKNKVRGEQMWCHKLTENQVRQIRNRANESDRRLAKEFGVSKTTIDRVRSRKLWRSVE